MLRSFFLTTFNCSYDVLNSYVLNNHITACRYRTSTDKFDSHVFKCINKNDHVAKEPYFKVYVFMTVNNENKLLCYECYFHKM